VTGSLPPLAEFLRWIAEMPAAFRGDHVRIRAVVADLFETHFGEPPRPDFLQAFEASSQAASELNRLRWILAACHVLWHPAFRGLPLPGAGVRRLLAQDLSALAAVVSADKLAQDGERREELARRVLAALGLRLPGESMEAAADRLTQLDSVEARKILESAVEKERRAKKKREEELRKKAQEEAAAKGSRE